MQIRQKLIPTIFLILMVLNSIFSSQKVAAQSNTSSKSKSPKGSMLVGISAIDITPDGQSY